MKMKFKLDGPTIQEFLFNHVEKIVLGVVALMLALFVYMGTQLEGMTGEITSPDKLLDKSRVTNTQLNAEDRWKEFAQTRDVPKDVAEKTLTVLKPTKSEDYAPKIAYDLPHIPRAKLRDDPKIYAPLHIKVAALRGPLAIKREDAMGPGGGGPLAGGPVKDPLSGDLPVGTVPGSSPYGEMTRPVGPPGGLSGERPSPTTKDKKKKGPNVAEYDYSSSPPVDMPAMNPGGPTPGGAVRGRTEGYAPGGADSTFAAGKAVVVMAAVPWQQQFDEYQRVLAEALDFRPERDYPQYLGFVVQRADVTADPDAAADKLKWEEPLKWAAARKMTTEVWQGFPMELIDPDWCDVALTQPAPPFMFRDLTDALLHPEFPLLADALAEMQAEADPRNQARQRQQNQPASDDPFGGSSSDVRGSELYGPTSGSGMRTKSPFQHWQGTQQGGGRGPEGMIGPGSGPGLTMKALTDSIRKYKLLRFTDTTVQPGKIYRYRVKVALEDPNKPRNAALEPLVTSLDSKVKNRLAQLAAGKSSFLTSDWSEVSPAVELPPADHFYAVAATPPKLQQIRDDLPQFIDKDASAKTLVVLWSEKKSVDVPGVTDVSRGTALTFVKDAEVLHPVTATPRKISDFSFNTEAVVADINGGETIKARNLQDSSSLKTPGEMLVFDDQGRWHVLDETYDADARMRFVPEDESDEGETTPVRRPTRSTRPAAGPGAPGFGGPEGMMRGPGRAPPGQYPSQAPPQGYPGNSQPKKGGRTR